MYPRPDDIVIQTQESKFNPWLSEAEPATSRSLRFSKIMNNLRREWEETFCFFENRMPGRGGDPRALAR